jgi:hypothetical protein
MRWWIFALLLCGVTIVGHQLSLRWGSRDHGARANLALGLAAVALILAAMIFYFWQ